MKVKRLLIIFLSLAWFAGLEAVTEAEYDLRSVDLYQQVKLPAQANPGLAREADGVEAGDSSTRDKDRGIEQRGDDEVGNGGDHDEGEDDNGDENGKEGGSNRFWNVAEFG
jgi:hypothetical protein